MLSGLTFQTVLLVMLLAISRSYYPREAGTSRVWADPRSLATTGGITNLFSFPAGTKMFQFPAFASPERRCPVFNRTGCPIRKSAGQGSFAPHRGLSQLITSFIACKSLGIHRSPLPTFLDTIILRARTRSLFKRKRRRHTSYGCSILPAPLDFHIGRPAAHRRIFTTSCFPNMSKNACVPYGAPEWRITDSNR